MEEQFIQTSDSPEKKASDLKQTEMSELMKAHLNEVAGGLASHSSWGQQV
jgi:hypothetical protein